MLKKKLFILCAVFMTAVFFYSCTYDKAALIIVPPIAACDTTSAKFSADVQPIILSTCAVSGCHDFSFSGGYSFLKYEDVKAALDVIQQQAIVNKTMPQDGPLPQSEINILKCWIEAGAQNN